MDKTVGYVLCSQSPALFLLGIVLLLCYLFRRKRHKVLAVLDLVLAIVSVLGGVALYFLGMSRDYFNIHNFYQIRTPGWIGLAVVAVLAVVAAVRAFARMADERRTEKAAIRAENARRNEAEQAAKEAEKAAAEAEKAAAQAAREAEQATAQMMADVPPVAEAPTADVFPVEPPAADAPQTPEE